MMFDYHAPLAHNASNGGTAVININALRIKRKQLRVNIAKRKRLISEAAGDIALRLARANESDEEHIIILDLMISNQAFAVRSLYVSECYGPAQ